MPAMGECDTERSNQGDICFSINKPIPPRGKHDIRLSDKADIHLGTNDGMRFHTEHDRRRSNQRDISWMSQRVSGPGAVQRVPITVVCDSEDKNLRSAMPDVWSA